MEAVKKCEKGAPRGVSLSSAMLFLSSSCCVITRGLSAADAREYINPKVPRCSGRWRACLSGFFPRDTCASISATPTIDLLLPPVCLESEAGLPTCLLDDVPSLQVPFGSPFLKNAASFPVDPPSEDCYSYTQFCAGAPILNSTPAASVRV